MEKCYKSEIRIEEWRSLYQALPEAEKRRLCHSLVTSKAIFWKAWLKKASLDKGGNRPAVVADRRSAFHQHQLDRNLFELPFAVWSAILSYFCKALHDGLVTIYQTSFPRHKGVREAILDEFKALVEQQKLNSPHPVLDLFAAVASHGHIASMPHPAHQCGQNDIDEERSDDPGEPNKKEVLRQLLADFCRLHASCSRNGQLLETSVHIEGDPVEDFAAFVKTRSELIRLGQETIFTFDPEKRLEWNSVAEATRLIEEIIADPRFEPTLPSAEAEFWREVLEMLKIGQTSNRLPRRRMIFIQARDETIQCLEELLRNNAPPPLPLGPKRSGREWLAESVAASNENLGLLDDWLCEHGLSRLSEVITEIDLSSLVETRISDEAPSPVHGDGFQPEHTKVLTNTITAIIPPKVATTLSSDTDAPYAVEAKLKDSALLIATIEETKIAVDDANPVDARSSKNEFSDKPDIDSLVHSRMSTCISEATISARDVGANATADVWDLSWRLLAEGETALAFWLCRNRIGIGSPSPTALEMLALAQWSPRHSLATSVRMAELSALLHEEQLETLSLAACLLPALLEPMSHAAQHLASLGLHALPILRELRKTILDFSEAHIALTPELLDSTQGHVLAQTRRSELRRRLHSWWQQAPTVNIISLPAKDVWRSWLVAHGWLSDLVQPLLSDGDIDSGRIQDMVQRFSDTENIAQEAERTYSQVLKHRGNLIVRAREQIVRNAMDAVTLAAEWLRVEGTPLKGNDFREARTRDLRNRLSAQVPASLIAIQQHLSTTSLEIPQMASLRSLERSLKVLESLLEGAPTREAREPAEILARPLLRCPGIELAHDWHPIVSADQPGGATVQSILSNVLTQSLPSWSAARHRHLQTGDLLSFKRCVDFASDEGTESEAVIGDLEIEGADVQKARADSVRRQVRATEELLDEALRQGLFNEQDYRNTEAELRSVDHAVTDGELRFHTLSRRVSGIVTEITSRRKSQEQEVEKRLKQLLSAGLDEKKAVRITAAIQGDLITAIDYLERAERGDDLPPIEEDARDVFTRFFEPGSETSTSAFTRICRHLLEERHEHPTPRQIPDWIRNGKEFAGLTHSTLPKPQREDGARLVETWLDIKQRKRITEQEATTILSVLGFSDVRVGVQQVSGRCWLEVKTKPETSRQRCPLPAYGSEARGHYRIWCVWSRPSEEEIITMMEGASHGARIIFHFGTLAGKANALEHPRREMARLALDRRRRFLLLDDALIVFLATEGAPRLRSFINCAAPFSHNEPFAATAGQVPPEMFFGREWEMEQIVSTSGSSFLFGGRQLGKTVLLKFAAKSFHSPAEERIACWLDLKDKGIGMAHSLDKLWEVLGVELKNAGVLGENFRPASRPDSFLRETERWVQANGQRRILLLLDEADDFLNADAVDSAQEYQRCSLIKGLMDRTDRRFKVVFAGLHNVQRSTRTANQPLAHFGEPLCIGPMLRGQEAKAAAELIEQPLRACGFSLDLTHRSQLVTRILAQNNYYPSLIQLFCQKLVEFCFHAGRSRFDQRQSPPWRLTLAHIKEAEKLETVRRSIRDKFILTLDLDKRFRLIAFLMAHHDGDHDGGGFHVPEIARMARDWWPAGFANSRSDEVFGDLLEEMVGLGVLRRVSNRGTYALRSPNLISLMGSAADIEADLLSSLEWEVKPEYDPQHFHQTLDESGHERSPFTAHQEARLFASRQNMVAVVTGCTLSGLNSSFRARLRQLSSKTPFDLVEAIDADIFQHALRSLAQRTEERLVIAIPPETPWDQSWYQVAVEKIRALKSEGKFVTVIFTLNPAQPRAGELKLSTNVEQRIENFSLGPWHSSALRQWFERANFGADEAARPEVRAATGGWPFLIERYLRMRQEGASCELACRNLIKEQLGQTRLKTEIFDSFGFGSSDLGSVLTVAAELAGETSEPVRWNDILAYAEVSDTSASASFQQLEAIQAVVRSEHTLTLDPILVRCIRTWSGL